MKNEQPLFWSQPVLLMDKFDDLEFVWKSGNEITVSYSKAKIHEFRNYWYMREDDKISQEIELILVKK